MFLVFQTKIFKVDEKDGGCTKSELLHLFSDLSLDVEGRVHHCTETFGPQQWVTLDKSFC